MSKARETSVDIHVPQLEAVLARWRNATVPVAAKGVPPHVSLLYPWRTPPLAAADLDELRAAIASHPPFPITFTGLGRFSPSVLFLKLADETAVRTLMQAIHAAFPDTPPYGGAFGDPTPHLTVAKAASDAELDRMEREIAPALAPCLPLVVRVERIVVMEEDALGNWRDVARLPLATRT